MLTSNFPDRPSVEITSIKSAAPLSTDHLSRHTEPMDQLAVLLVAKALSVLLLIVNITSEMFADVNIPQAERWSRVRHLKRRKIGRGVDTADTTDADQSIPHPKEAVPNRILGRPEYKEAALVDKRPIPVRASLQIFAALVPRNRDPHRS